MSFFFVFRPCPLKHPESTLESEAKHSCNQNLSTGQTQTGIKQHVRLVHSIDRFRPVPIFVPIFCLFQSNLNPLQFGNDTYPPVRMSEILPQFGLLLFS